jgi:hypothetical protein
MLNNLNKNQLYSSTAISFAIFIFLNFSIGATSVFGINKFLQNKTGYYFGVDINTLDYFLISLIPFFGLLLNSKMKRNNFTEIIKANVIIFLSCISTFSFGLIILISKIGSPGENPLIPQYLRVEPFKIYSTFFIALGIIIPFFLIKIVVKEIENGIDEIGKQI